MQLRPRAILEICQKINTTGYSDQKFYTPKVRNLRLFLLKMKQRKCIDSNVFFVLTRFPILVNRAAATTSRRCSFCFSCNCVSYRKPTPPIPSSRCFNVHISMRISVLEYFQYNYQFQNIIKQLSNI